MAVVRTRVEPIDRDINLILAEELSPKARRARIAEVAGAELRAAQDRNRAALGRVPPHETFVDGRAGAALNAVKPDGGVIVFEFELLDDVFVWVRDQLVRHSPRLTGEYAKSHVFLADGVEVAVGAAVPVAREYVFVNTLPFARKIERGFSQQAPDGVYQVVATLASRRFGNLARIRFSYRTLLGSVKDKNTRQPAIVITV